MSDYTPSTGEVRKHTWRHSVDTKQAWQLLTLASGRDGRTVDQAVAMIWANDLFWIDYEDAVTAVTEHYRTSEKWLMPVHVIQGVKRIRETRERLQRRQQRALPERVITMPPLEVLNQWTADATKQQKEAHDADND